MKLDSLRATVLAVRILPNVDIELRKTLKLSDEQRSLGIITVDCDDVAYSALDDATKRAEVEVVYAKSMYAGASNASTKLAGEFVGMIAGRNPAEVKSGLEAAIEFIEHGPSFISANDEDSISYFAHTISRTGRYLASVSGIPEGAPLAYCIAPPLEAMCALDEALKAADVRLVAFYGPPSETNFGGGLLTGSQMACQAACEAFEKTVLDIAALPIKL